MTTETTPTTDRVLGMLPEETRRPAWLCACGTTLHATRLPHTHSLDAVPPPRCPVCAAHGAGGRYALQQVTITITEGWAR